jgi:hypothetical protein
MATNSYPSATEFLRDLLRTASTEGVDAIPVAEWRHVRITRPEGHAEVQGLFLLDGNGQPYFLTLEGKAGVRIEIARYDDLSFLDGGGAPTYDDIEPPTGEVASPQQP